MKNAVLMSALCVGYVALACLPAYAQHDITYVTSKDGQNVFAMPTSYSEDLNVPTATALSFFTVSEDGLRQPVAPLYTDAYYTLSWQDEEKLILEAAKDASSGEAFAVLAPDGRHPLDTTLTEYWGLMLALHGRQAVALTPDGDRILTSRYDDEGVMRVYAYDYRTEAETALPIEGIVAGVRQGKLYYQKIDDENGRRLYVTPAPYEQEGTYLTELDADPSFQALADGRFVLTSAEPQQGFSNTEPLLNTETGETIHLDLYHSASMFYDERRGKLGLLHDGIVRYYDWEALLALKEAKENGTFDERYPAAVSSDPQDVIVEEVVVEEEVVEEEIVEEDAELDLGSAAAEGEEAGSSSGASGEPAPSPVDLDMDDLERGAEGAPLLNYAKMFSASAEDHLSDLSGALSERQKRHVSLIIEAMAERLSPESLNPLTWRQEEGAAELVVPTEDVPFLLIRLEPASGGGLQAVINTFPLHGAAPALPVPAALGTAEQTTYDFGRFGTEEIMTYTLRLNSGTDEGTLRAFAEAFFDYLSGSF